MSNSNIFAEFQHEWDAHKVESYTFQEFLDICATDPLAYANASERMVAAIGEPVLIDTRTDPRLSRIHQNRVIKQYPAFSHFYGMEHTIEDIVAFYQHAAQGLEEAKQILYLLGPVGSAKSTLAELLKKLMETYPIYTLRVNGEVCPNFESPFNMLDPDKYGQTLLDEYGINPRYLTGVCGPWVTKRLNEFNGDITKFEIIKLHPSILTETAIAKTEPGDENNQDISALVGKTDIRKIEDFSQNDVDSYSFSGGLCRANQGILEFVEMFKAPIKVLHPLLTATQEGNYKGTEGIPAIPFNGTILAHSNESEWNTFKGNKNNEAFLDRVSIIKVPYCLRVDEEVLIYQKLLNNSSLAKAPCAPHTLELLAKWIILTRLKDPENSSIYTKLKVYNGENVKDTAIDVKSIVEFSDSAGVNEGMDGNSTRFAFKILSKVFNYDSTKEIAANPVHLFRVLEDEIVQQQYPEEREQELIGFLKKELQSEYLITLGKEIRKNYMESYQEYGQNMFNRYVNYADYWIKDEEYRDPDTGSMFDRNELNKELEKVEKSVGISNVKDFRNEVVNFCLRYRATHAGEMPSWTSYNKIKTVLEARMFSSQEDVIPMLSFAQNGSEEDKKKYNEFVERMVACGYTPHMVHLLCEYWDRSRQSQG